MLRVAGALLLIALYIYFIIDVLRTPSSQTRSLPRWAWLLIVVLVPIIGGVLWMAFGRVWPESGRWRRRRPAAPDDDPRFLKQISDDAWAERMRRRREQDGPGGQETPA